MTEMIEVKTDELIGPALDWAVCKACCGVEIIVTADYSSDWAQGGPLIDEYEICIICLSTCDPTIERLGGGDWSAKTRESDHDYSRLSPTPLVAACRAILRAKFGDTVSVPKELMK